MKMFQTILLILVILGVCHTVGAYPEFQQFIVKNSGRSVNCAMCHSNSDGPDGTGVGQIGKLTPAQFQRLGQARAAFESGVKVDSPILNEFGNHIIQSIGKKKFLEVKLNPAMLVELLPKESDLDRDGIPDVREYLDGTHPLNPHDGHPWLLFKSNFQKNLIQIVLTVGATVAGIYGLTHLLRGFAKSISQKE